MKSRGVVALLAVIMAAIATMAVFLYIQGVRKEARTGGGGVAIIVAEQDIPAGTELNDLIEEGAFSNQTLPQDQVVVGAVSSLEDLRDQKTSSPILEGEQVSTARLQGSTELPGGVLGIPKGYEGITVALDIPRVVGSAIQPGDRVKIHATFKGEDGQGVTVNLVDEAKVLKFLGRGDSSIAEAGGTQAEITLSLTPKEASALVYAQENGTVWLSLLSPGDDAKHVPPMTLPRVIR